MRIPTSLLACAVLLAATACSKSKPPQPAGAAAGQPQASLQGPVREAISASNYTYLRIATAGGDQWAAVPAGDFKVGQPVAVSVQMRMDKFESPTLKRTFDPLYMGTVAGAGGPAPAMPGMAPAPAAPAGPDEKVAKAAGAEARTVAEVWAQKAGLKDRSVTVRGKVVKCNEGILGRTWLHLRDGSGDAGRGDNDLCVTTKEPGKLGDVVTVKGVVHLDRDFGAGYAYKVIVEDASIVR